MRIELVLSYMMWDVVENDTTAFMAFRKNINFTEFSCDARAFAFNLC